MSEEVGNLLDVMDAVLEGREPPTKVTLSGCPGGVFEVGIWDLEKRCMYPIGSPEAKAILERDYKRIAPSAAGEQQ